MACLDQDGSVRVADASDVLAVSPMTIRRDLDELEARGAAQRVRGGARALPANAPQPPRTAVRARKRIAAKVAALLPTEGAIALDSSPTVRAVVAQLDGFHQRCVVTNGPETFLELRGRPGVVPLITGGQLDRRTNSLVGPLALRTASRLSVHTFVASAAALSTDGSLASTCEEAELQQAIARRAHRTVLAVESASLTSQGLALALPWATIDILVTDLDSDDPRLAAFHELASIL